MINVRTIDNANDQKVHACCQNLKLFMALHHQIVLRSNLIIVGLVVVPDVTKIGDANNVFCAEYRRFNLFISQGDIIDACTFTEWWGKNMHPLVTSLRNWKLPAKESQVIDLFTNIIKFVRKRIICQSQIILSDEQEEVININKSKENKIIVTGPFGCGKSILGILQLTQLFKIAIEKTKIFYLIDQVNSLYELKMKEIVKSFPENKLVEVISRNVDVIRENLGLANSVSISEVIKQLFLKHKNEMVHIIIDEYDGEILDKFEALKMKNIVIEDQDDRVKAATVWVIGHSLKSRREYINRSSDVEEYVKHNKYQYALTGMKVYELGKVFRNKKTVNDILNVACNKI